MRSHKVQTVGSCKKGVLNHCSFSCIHLTFLAVFLWSFIVGHLHGRSFVGMHFLANIATDNQAPTTTATRAKLGANNTDEVNLDELPYNQLDRWHTIRVFQGDADMHLRNTLKPSHNNKSKRWFAHKSQDKLVLGLLRNKQRGYFIDLAANEAIATSNTLALELNANWTGLCIEPNPVYWYALAYYRRCHVVAAVVGKKPMEHVYFRYKGMWGGIVGDEFDNQANMSKGDFRIQFTAPLLDILQLYQAPPVIDYLNLDVEGAEEFILQHFPFSHYKFSILTVERPKDSLQALLNRSGYVFLKQIAKWGETVWAHESVLAQLDLNVLKKSRKTD
jgi:hypothetical protein